MPDLNHILDAIDHALDDWSVSPDAMRWGPEPRRPATPTGGQVIGTTIDETHLFRDVDLRPYQDAIRRDVRFLASLYRTPPYVHDVVYEDWSDGSGTRTERYRRADGAWITDTITRASDGVERLDNRVIETIRDVTS